MILNLSSLRMNVLTDILQAILLVILVGAMFVAIPIVGLLFALAAFVAFVYMVIQDEREHPPE